MSKIVPHLWYTKEAVEAANFYASVFPDSRVDNVTQIPAETPSGRPELWRSIPSRSWSSATATSCSRCCSTW